MTLYKQMAIAISFMIITILITVMSINYQTAKDNMIENLYQTTVNNMSSITNKIANTGSEPALIKSIIDSEFDSGYYKLIKFITNDSSFTYAQKDMDPLEGVPKWFVNFTNINIKPVTADVTSEWSIMGQVTVEADADVIYKALYQTFVRLLYLFAIFAIVSLILLNILLHFILKPLTRIQYQAEAITKNEFVIEEKKPYIKEFRKVSNAMNVMVKKVEEIFNKANEAALYNRELLYNDPITKLFNRRYLMLKLPELIQLETKNDGGSIIFLALDGAEILNKQLGRQEADEFFHELAKILSEACEDIEEKVIARVNGTEFMLMLPNCESYMSHAISRDIFERFLELVETKEIDTQKINMNIGIYRYRPDVKVAELLTRADDALTKAKADERQSIYVYEEKSTKNALPKEQWRAILEESIEKNNFSLKFWPTVDVTTNEIVHQVITFTIADKEDKKFSYGDFIAPAITLGLVEKMYVVVLKNLFTTKHPELAGGTCSLRLSNEFLKDSTAFDELSSLLLTYEKKLNFKLCLEVSNTFAINNVATVKGFADLFKKYNFGFSINSFTLESGGFAYLKELNPEFIKADVSFLLDQTKESMNNLEVVTKSLGIEIIATYVKNKEELDALKEIGINKVQGPILENM